MRIMKNLVLSVTLAAAAFVAHPVPPVHAATWNAVTDFSIASNPNGVWAYGYGLAGTSFTAYSYSNSTYAGATNVDYWANGQDTVPEVGKNVGGSNATCCSTVLIPPGVLWIHPGQSGDTDTIVQWTAPANGNYSYAGSFAILDTSPTGVIGEVFKNASALYSGVLTGPPASLSGTIGGSEPFGGTVSLNAGDVLSFAVNRNGNYSDDSTALTLTISTATPLPAALPLFASGLGAIGFVGWRRKRKQAHAVT